MTSPFFFVQNDRKLVKFYKNDKNIFCNQKKCFIFVFRKFNQLNHKIMKTYQEITRDKGAAKTAYASNSNDEFILTSAMAKDMYNEFVDNNGRYPSRAWYYYVGINFQRTDK